MTRSLTPAVWALLALAPFASAQTYNLKDEYQPQAGDTVGFEVHDFTLNRYTVYQGGQPLQQAEEPQGSSHAFTAVVVSAEGEVVTEETRLYSSFKDLATETELLDGELEISITRPADGGQGTWSAPNGEDLPDMVKAHLDEEVAEDDDDEDNPFLPSSPVEVGESWEVEFSRLAEKFGIENQDDLILDECFGSATLTDVSMVEGAEVRTIVAEVQVTCARFQQMECPEPLVFAFTVTVRVSPDAPIGDFTMEGTLTGQAVPPDVPQGFMLEFDTTMARSQALYPSE